MYKLNALSAASGDTAGVQTADTLRHGIGGGTLAVVFLLAAVLLFAVWWFAAEARRRKEEEANRQAAEARKREADRLEKQAGREKERLDAEARNLERNRQEEEARQEEERRRLLKEYSGIILEIRKIEAEKPYRDRFLKYGPFYQILIGLARGDRFSSIPAERFTDEILICARNTNLEIDMEKGRFLPVSAPLDEKSIQEEAKRAVQNLDIQKLRRQTDRERRYLEQVRNRIPYRILLEQTQNLLKEILRDAQNNSKADCIKAIGQIEAILKGAGCYFLYAGDKIVQASESLTADFRDDNSIPAELPGIYVKVNGEYSLIHGCGGTRRC